MSDVNEKNHGTLTGDNHAALWSGRFTEGPDAAAVEFETSIRVDERMALDDIHGSIAHAQMLGEQKIISKSESSEIVKGLKSIEKDLIYGSLAHYHEQNGDLCPDPDISFRIDQTAKTIEVLDYTDYFGFQNVYTDDGKKVYPTRKKSLNNFLGQWLTNLKKQGFKNQ